MFFSEQDAELAAPDGLVTVGRFGSPIEGQMAKGMLESAGVECWMVGENANNLLGAAFRVRVQVLLQDEAEARELLQAAVNGETLRYEDRRELN